MTAFAGASHKKFNSEAEARAFVDGVAPTPTRTLDSFVKASGSGGTKQARARDEEGDSAPDVKRAKVTSGSGHEKVFGKNGADRTVFTDGSSIGNGQVGSVAGYGVFWGHGLDHLCVGSGLEARGDVVDSNCSGICRSGFRASSRPTIAPRCLCATTSSFVASSPLF